MNSFIKPLTIILGVVLTLAGIAGFFVDGMLFMFEVDTTHTIVHLLSGVIALAVARNEDYAHLYLVIFGFVYGAVAVIGYLTGSAAGFFAVNDADNYLHTGIAIVCLIVGLRTGRKAGV